ncbi:MAG: aminotransferase class I/II-fold pyridoxal phosphate-dependent enzyme [Oscillospiraceae bacterium]|nr:aminotransferase class I/II-fold pyridoxal phosphate-dependent enzyme [Oscillospiraceae bacterium]
MVYQFDKTLDHRKNGSYRWRQPEGREDVIGMGTADMDYASPPCLKDAVKQVWEENTFNYRGISPEYTRAVIGWYQRTYGLALEKAWLTSAPGTIGAIRIALELYSERGDYVLLQAPYFSPLKRAIEGAGCRALLNPMVLRDGRFELDLEEFERQVRTYRPSIFLMVNPQNPTGRVFARAELERMTEICHENHVVIISDEVHSLITFGGSRHIPVLDVSQKARDISVQVMSVSKGFNMMGLPHAIVAIANRDMKARWDTAAASYSFSYAYNAYTMAAVTAIMSGRAEDWLREVTAYLKENRDLFISGLREKRLPLTPYAPEAGFLLWADCRASGLDPERLEEEFLNRAGISLNNGLEHGELGRGFIRLNFAVTRENLSMALERIDRMFKS